MSDTRASERRLEASLALVLCVIAAFVLTRGLDWGLSAGIETVAGDRILQGELPYRDFWTVYAPGSAASAALVFALFGRELHALHMAAAMLGVGAVAVLFAAMRRAGAGPWLAFAVGLVYALALWTPSPELGTYVVPRVLLVLGWERVLRALQTGRTGPLLAAGAAFGVAAWFKHDVGAYATIGSAVALLGAHFVRPRGALFPSGTPRALWTLSGAAAVALLPALVAVAATGGTETWRSLVVFPATDFQVVRGEAYPALIPDLEPVSSWLSDPADLRKGQRAGVVSGEWLLANAPQWVFVVAFAMLVALVRTRAAPRLAVSLVLPLACMPLYWLAAHTQQNTHVYSMALLSALLLPMCWRAGAVLRSGRTLRGVLVVIFSIYAAALCVRPATEAFQMRLEATDAYAWELPGARGMRVAAADHQVYRPIVDFVRANVPEDEPIHVALRRHDSIVIGDPRFYYLAGRRAATRYHELHPGIVDRDAVQREMIDALEAQAVRCVIRWNFGWDDARLDEILADRRKALPDLGSRRLDRYLDAHFERVGRYGEYDVLWRRS